MKVVEEERGHTIMKGVEVSKAGDMLEKTVGESERPMRELDESKER